MEENILNLIEATYKIPTANTVNSKRLNAFLKRWGASQGCLLLKLVFGLLLEVLARVVRHETKIKAYRLERKK